MPKKGSSKSRPSAPSKNTRGTKIQLPLPEGINRSQLFSLWLRACRRDPNAQQCLYRLTADPKIQRVINQFVKERNDFFKSKDKGNRNVVSARSYTAWEQMSSRGSGWISTVSGGLPSLGKHR